MKLLNDRSSGVQINTTHALLKYFVIFCIAWLVCSQNKMLRIIFCYISNKHYPWLCPSCILQDSAQKSTRIVTCFFRFLFWSVFQSERKSREWLGETYVNLINTRLPSSICQRNNKEKTINHCIMPVDSSQNVLHFFLVLNSSWHFLKSKKKMYPYMDAFSSLNHNLTSNLRKSRYIW